MEKAKMLLVLAAVIFGACAGGGESNTNTAANSAYYQTPPASRESAVAITSTPQRAGSTSNSNGSSTSGGGGGGGKTKNQIVTQQVSLNQAENVQNQPVVTDRKIIRNADLQLESDAPDEAQQKITVIAEGKGGFVVESQQSSSDARSGKRDTVTMNVRVPADKFGETLEEIRKTASRVVVETVKSDDVTEEFIDIEAQLKAKKSLEAQFLEIMKRANTVEDALEVQRQLAEVRGEIEKVEGRKRFLENQSALSTIKIRLQTPTTLTANSDGFGYRLKESFGRGFDAALSFILALVSFVIAILPFLIFIVLPIYLVIRYFLKKRGKQPTVSRITKDELKDE